MTTDTEPTLETLTMAELVDEVGRREAQQHEAGFALYEAKEALIARMEAVGAEVADSAAYEIKKTVKNEYDPNTLDGIRELVPEHLLVQAGAYTPERDVTKTVPRSWSMIKTPAFGKRGETAAEVTAIIERAKRPLRPTLKVVAK
jgi:hypothetical protein